MTHATMKILLLIILPFMALGQDIKPAEMPIYSGDSAYFPQVKRWVKYERFRHSSSKEPEPWANAPISLSEALRTKPDTTVSKEYLYDLLFQIKKLEYHNGHLKNQLQEQIYWNNHLYKVNKKTLEIQKGLVDDLGKIYGGPVKRRTVKKK